MNRDMESDGYEPISARASAGARGGGGCLREAAVAAAGLGLLALAAAAELAEGLRELTAAPDVGECSAEGMEAEND